MLRRILAQPWADRAYLARRATEDDHVFEYRELARRVVAVVGLDFAPNIPMLSPTRPSPAISPTSREWRRPM